MSDDTKNLRDDQLCFVASTRTTGALLDRYLELMQSLPDDDVDKRWLARARNEIRAGVNSMVLSIVDGGKGEPGQQERATPRSGSPGEKAPCG